MNMNGSKFLLNSTQLAEDYCQPHNGPGEHGQIWDLQTQIIQIGSGQIYTCKHRLFRQVQDKLSTSCKLKLLKERTCKHRLFRQDLEPAYIEYSDRTNIGYIQDLQTQNIKIGPAQVRSRTRKHRLFRKVQNRLDLGPADIDYSDRTKIGQIQYQLTKITHIKPRQIRSRT